MQSVPPTSVKCHNYGLYINVFFVFLTARLLTVINIFKNYIFLYNSQS